MRAYEIAMESPDSAMRTAGTTQFNQFQQKQAEEQQAQAKQAQLSQLWQESGGDAQKFLAATGGSADGMNFATRMVEGKTLGVPTVVRTVETVDNRGRPATQQLDARGNPVGAPIPIYVPPKAPAAATAPKPAGPDWKYDAGSDAWVKPPSADFPMGQTTPNSGKAASLKNFDYLATNMMGEDGKGGTIAKTAQGGYFGLGGALGSGTQAAKEFDNTVEQMSTELRTVFRIPGEGALSDKEQAQYGIQLPKRGNSADLNRKIITDLRVRMNNRVNPQGAQSPATPQKTVVRTGTANGRKVVQYSDGTTAYAD
jgi:hypothetical protein